MTHQEELMKDWSPKRRVEALFIVSSNLPLFMEYGEEELMALRQNNQDVFDLFESTMKDKADEIIRKYS
ncbi:hypothetical protein [uncultured phage]|nr:hypothetical protein [uncultured phage]